MVSVKEYKEFYKDGLGWTAAFEHAVSDLERAGGGMLTVSPGIYETCSIELKSNITLHIEAGAEIRFIQDCSKYKVIESCFEGRTESQYMPCIYAKNAENVTVCGMGTVNGQGEYWWQMKDRLSCSRPYLICFEHCTRVKVLDVKLINSPVWTIHPLCCEDVEVRGVSIRNPWDSPNTDGINPESCRDVRIADCLIDVGDDCITLKAGTEDVPYRIPCMNIAITNCNMVHGHGGIVIGSEMSGTVRNVVISNCVFCDTDRGIRVKTRRGRGGAMEDILVSNVLMERVICPFVFNMYYHCGPKKPDYKDKFPHEIDKTTPRIRNIQIQNCMVSDATAAAGFFYGLPEMPIQNVTISDSVIRMKEGAEKGLPAMMEDLPLMAQENIFMKYVENVNLRNVQVQNSRDADWNQPKE